MHYLIYCTCPNQDIAELIARQLIDERLAACVNILPGVTSVYEWEGQIEFAQEHLLLIKSQASRYPAIEKTIKSLHPYQLPEIIAVEIDRGSKEYMNWIDSCMPAN